MNAPEKRKRGRPPRTFTSRDGTEMTLAEMGISRKVASDAIAIASIPHDVFEKRLAETASGKYDRRRCTTQALVRLACELGTTNRKAPMRDPSALDDARKAMSKLSREEIIALVRELVAEIESEAAS